MAESKKAPVAVDEGILEQDIMMEEVNDNGTIRISDDVIISVVKHYTLNVPGVVRFASSGIASDIAGFLGKKRVEKSVNIEEVDGEYVNISVALVIQFGEVIPDLAAKVQETIRTMVEELTGKQVGSVNVNISDLAMKAQKDEESDQESDEFGDID